ncbi:hypothetical protein ACA910_017416 [Epithemia clementina (nom. ined.)]
MGSKASKPSSDKNDEEDTTTSKPTLAKRSDETTTPSIHDHDDCPHLYNLHNTQMTIEMKNKLLQCFGNRYRLPSLQNTLISDKGGQAIIDIVEASSSKKKRDWHSFLVSNTKIGDVSMEALFKAFASTYATDAFLFLSEETNMDDETAVSLAEALQNNPSWKKLDLRSSQIGKTGWQALSLALHSNTVWEKLSLYGTVMDDEAATALFAALQPNKTWKELNLSGLKISMDEAKVLAGAWTVNTSWSRLNLYWSNVGEKGIAALSEAKRCNDQWQVLNLVETELGDDGAVVLASAMQHNTSWKELDFHFSRIGVEGATALAAALERHDRWQYLILNIFITENEIKRIAQYLQQSKDWERFVLHFGCSKPFKVVEAIISRPNAVARKSFVLWFSYLNSRAVKALVQQLINFPSVSDVLITDTKKARTMDLNDFLGKSWHDTEIYYFDGKKIYSKTEEKIFSSVKSSPLSKEATTNVAQLAAQVSTSPNALYDKQRHAEIFEDDMTSLHLVCRNASKIPIDYNKMKIDVECDPWILRDRLSDGSMPLHVLCCNNPPLDIVELFVQSWEPYIRTPNLHGWLPIHCACAHRASYEVVKFLAQADKDKQPNGDRTLYQKTYQHSNTVLHLACANAPPVVDSHEMSRASSDPSLDIVKLLVELAPTLLLETNSDGELAVHVATRSCAFDLVQFLYEQYPESKDIPEKNWDSCDEASSACSENTSEDSMSDGYASRF